MRLFSKTLIAALLILCLLQSAFPQTEVGVPLKDDDKKAFVLDFRSPYTELVVDIDQNKFLELDHLVLPITASTRFVNKNKKPIDRSLIRSGVQIEITGDYFKSTNRIVPTEIKVLTELEKWNVEFEGYYGSLDGETAWIDGQGVKLRPGATIKGTEEWKGKTFASFNDMELGSLVTVKGVRSADGFIYANGGETKPNMFTDGDVKLLNLVKANMLWPSSLAGGKGKVAGREVTFVNDLELQTYVTKIGNRLIPRYEKDLADDYKGKKVYRFAVIEDNSFNAFALPDGSIFIHTGLLKQVKNEAQLAAIIGHEIAHVTNEHGRRSLEGGEKREWGTLGAMIGGSILGGKTGAAIAATGMGAVHNHYSRKLEDQADRVGLNYMVQAGFDPREAPKVWQEISRNTKQNPITTFLYSSHPLARERFKHLNRQIALNYSTTDLGNTKIGTEEYMNAVGPYFGWRQKPAPKVITSSKAAPATSSILMSNGLPRSINTLLNRSYAGWKLLSGDPTCNSRAVVSGNFDGVGGVDYAVMLSKGKTAYVIAFLAAGKTYRAVRLDSGLASDFQTMFQTIAPKGSEYAPIINDDLDRGHVERLTLDTIVGGACEASEYLYLYKSGKFKRVFTSD